MRRSLRAFARFGVAGSTPAGRLAAVALLAGAPPPDVSFTDVTATANVAFTHVNGASPDKHLPETMGSGGAFVDLDADGWVDIVLVDGGSIADPQVARRAQPRVLRNRRDGTFEDVTARVRHSSARLRHGRLRGRLRQRRSHRSLRHRRREQRAVQESRRLHLYRRDRVRRSGRRRLEHELRVCRSRRRWRPRSVRHPLRGSLTPRAVLRRRTRQAPRVLPSPRLAADVEPGVQERRQRRLHGCERVHRHRQVPQQRTRRRHLRSRRQRVPGRVRGQRLAAELSVRQRGRVAVHRGRAPVRASPLPTTGRRARAWASIPATTMATASST